ncbi:unnamed protein product [Boreogadus saida]
MDEVDVLYLGASSFGVLTVSGLSHYVGVSSSRARPVDSSYKSGGFLQRSRDRQTSNRDRDRPPTETRTTAAISPHYSKGDQKMFTMTGRMGLLLLLLFVNADAASTQQERKAGPANVAPPVAVPAARVVSGAHVPLVQNAQLVQNVSMMANMANNIGQQRQLIPLGTVNIANLGNVPVYGVPVSVDQAGQLQVGTLNLTGLNLGAALNQGGLSQAALNQALLNLANALGAASSGAARQMSAASVLAVVAANLWYHRSG